MYADDIILLSEIKGQRLTGLIEANARKNEKKQHTCTANTMNQPKEIELELENNHAMKIEDLKKWKHE